MPDEAEAEARHGDEQMERGKETGRRRKPASGGGKLGRSETVTVRLDPKLNYLCELAARAQRRTKSSFIEWAVSEALDRVVLPGSMANKGTIESYSDYLWDVEEADRLAQLAFHAPVLMTHEEQVIWKLVEDNGLLWKGHYAGPIEEWTWVPEHQFFRWKVFRQFYPVFKRVADGETPQADLPDWTKYRVHPDDVPAAEADEDLDSDVPF